MVGADPVAALAIDLLVDRFAQRKLARDDLGPKHVKLAQRLRRVLNLADEAFERGQFSAVANLAAAFPVEGRLVEQRFDRLADFGASRTRAPSLTIASTTPSPSSPE